MSFFNTGVFDGFFKMFIQDEIMRIRFCCSYMLLTQAFINCF